MKTIHAIYAFIVLAAATSFVSAQDYPDEYLGLPGDNLNLYAVMNLFQESETLEKFEQGLNSEDQMINNLDLNGDNFIDYITVSDFVDGNVHNIVLRAALNQNEQQDVAVFVVENLSNGAVQIQLIGDEALYGPNYIVEPIYAETPNPGYTGMAYRSNTNVVHTSYYDIAAWPVIRYIYRPGYVGWRSSWYWGYYPNYWRPWRAHYWHYYYGYHYHWHDHYYKHYRHWDRYRCWNYHTYYRNNVRVYSPSVVVNINNNQYRHTYSRPDQRHAGENHYTQTAHNRAKATRAGVYSARSDSRSGMATNRQTAQRTGTYSARTRSQVSANGRSAVQRSSSSSRKSSAVQRSQPGKSRSSVQRNQSASNRSSVQRSSSSKKATPAVQRSSSSSRKSSAVQRSQPTKSRSSVQRNQSASNRSSVQRSSSSKKATPAVQRSSSSSRKSSAVQRSQPSKSRSSVQRSSSSSKKATPTAQRSSSSRKKEDSRSSSSSSRGR